MAYDLLIQNARTRFYKDGLVDIGIEGQKITRIRQQLGRGPIHHGAAQVIDAEGRLVTESFINGHLHLCKFYTLGMLDDEAMGAYSSGSMGGAMTAIELAAKVKERYAEGWILENARKALNLAVKFGNTHIRAFADTDTRARLEGVKALLKARAEMCRC
ncbi:MAG TPA: amidohydrolase family protein [Anaerolineaceae bacterium]|nr:amidohydrolase family protein [Anaerolineaceae bacterium]